MSDWSHNNRAHVALWYSLRVLNELECDFETAGRMNVAELTFWNSLSSDDLRRRHARTLALQLDNMFRLVYRAGYEQGISREAAIAALFGAFCAGDNTLRWLGSLTDAQYAFRDEVPHA